MKVHIARHTVAITIGEHKSLGLDRFNNLMLIDDQENTCVYIGPLTQQRAREISEYLQRLAIHTPEK